MHDRYRPIRKEDLEIIHAGSLEILEHTGMWFECSQALDLFKKHGFRIDNERVYFEGSQVEAALKQTMSQFDVIAPDPAKSIHVGGDAMAFSSASSATRILDLDGMIRKPNSHDYEDVLKLIESLDSIDFMFEYLVPQDLPQKTHLIWNLFAQMHIVSKPLSCQTVDGIGLLAEFYDTDIARMRESSLKGLAYGITFVNPLSPLGLSAAESTKLTKCCRAGIAVALSPMVICGLTAPCTLEGALVQNNAEILGALVLSRLAAPGAPVLYGCLAAVPNMHNMLACVGAAESRIFEHAAAQMSRYYKIPSRSIAGMTDSNDIDYQAGAESMLHYVQLVRSGINVMAGAGGYANWTTACFEKLMLDAESIDYVKRLLRPLDFSPDRAAVDIIQSVGPRGSYILEEHTLEHFKDEFHESKIFDRRPYDAYAAGGFESCKKKANQKVREILDGFKYKPLEKSLDKRLRAYCERYGLGEYIKNRFV